ncbi:fimbria/pilus outer membrane usher protein [Pantoea sp.]|uniref:fimbria/pilus outer membrane usher protein n=1 Tax=Pantoea sp. TaxID=69393 RepID=UPI0031DEA3F8
MTVSLIALCHFNSAFANEVIAETGDIEFDRTSLQLRGVDPKLAEWFRQTPRFLAGESSVTLVVNGLTRGKTQVRFDDKGALCADADFLKKAGLIPPTRAAAQQACPNLTSLWPQTEVTLDPGEEKVSVVVPAAAVAQSRDDLDDLNHGGTAGMLNYDAQYLDSSSSASNINFFQTNTEAGLNIGDWIVRSRQTYSNFDGKKTLQHQGAYAQRTFTGLKKTLQAGQISLSNSMFGTGQVIGLQMVPEAALQNGRMGAGLVEGIATSQSVVEVRQSGLLVYSTTVPAGPFRLQGFSLLNTRTDLNVTVTSSDGDKRDFIVPAAALLQSGTAVSPGWSFGAGRLDQQGDSPSPLLATLATGWALSPATAFNVGVLGSNIYRAGAVGIDSQIFDATVLSVQTTAARDNHHGNSGLLARAALNHKLTDRVSISANATQQTEGYAELSDALQNNARSKNGRSRDQIGSTVSWSEKTVGNLSFSWARTRTFDGDSTSYLRAGWSKQIGRTYVGASLEHDTGSRNTHSDDRFYVTVSIPFGNAQNFSSYLNSSNRNTRGGVRYSNRASQDRNWSLASERDFRHRQTTNTATLDYVTSFSQLNGSVSQRSDSTTSWLARASGGLVAHGGGVTLSPYRISDTFGIAKVGTESSVRLQTASGPTWTDSRGYAVLPSITTYQRSSVQVDTRSLAKNVDIENAWQETAAARGSVSLLNFDVVRTRRVLVSVQDRQGNDLRHGASVFDSEGNFVTVVGSHGSVFIPDATAHQLDVQSSGQTVCSFSLALPEQADTSGLYETATAVCL